MDKFKETEESHQDLTLEATDDAHKRRRTNFFRYFIPWRFNCNREKRNHLEDSGFLQIGLFTWLFPLIWKGMKKNLEQDDLGDVSDNLSVNFALKKFKYFLEKERKRVMDDRKVSLFRVYLDFIKKKILVTILTLLFSITTEFFALAIVLPRFLTFLNSKDKPKEDGFVLAAIFIILTFCKQTAKNFCLFLSMRAGSCIKAAVMGLIYEKALKLKSIGNKSVGELVNMCGNDSQRIFECTIFLNSLILLPVVILLNGVYLSYYFGLSALAGLALVIGYIPLQVYLGRVFAKLRAKTAKITDKRVKMISEVFSSIKLIKMYAWEKSFSKVVYDYRNEERRTVQRMAFLQGCTFSLGYLLTALMPIIAVLVHVYSGFYLDVAKVYTLMAVFSQMSFYIITGPLSIRYFAETYISFKRLNSLLIMKDHVHPHTKVSNPENHIEIKAADLSWEKITLEEKMVRGADGETSDEQEDLKVAFKSGSERDGLVDKSAEIQMEEFIPTLFNINLCVTKNSLIGICGSVGSGKSSLLQALLGEMTLAKGSIAVSSSIAYVPQQAWILNATVRENILFGKEYEESFFKDVCTACALDDDLKGMTSGDLTEIGERGINLSGGQKQRISLARAVYAEKELYLLDDPLSAVDAHVGKHIFEKCIKLALRKHTVVFVTHQLQYLKDCDYVYYMKEGFIAEQGTYEQLMKDDKDFSHDVSKFHEEHQKEKKDDNEHLEFPGNSLAVAVARSLHSIHHSHACLHDATSFIDDQEEEQREIEELTKQGKLVTEEEKEKGSVSWGTYFAFCKFAGGYIPIFFTVLFILASVAAKMFTDYWLSLWLKTKDQQTLKNMTRASNSSFLSDKDDNTDFYMSVYGSAAVGILFFTLISTFVTVYVMLLGSTRMHNAVFSKLLGSPMEFFDTTPLGRVLNRLSKDVDDIDNYLPWLFECCCRYTMRVLLLLVSVATIFPQFLVALVPALFGFILFSFIYRKVVRAIKRIENVNRSPMLSHLSTTINGLSMVHAYKKEKEFTNEFHKLLNANNFALYLFNAASRWFGLYMDLTCILLVAAVIISSLMLKDTVPTSLAGLAIFYSLRVIGLVQFSMRILADFESKFTSVERMNHYVKTLESEHLFKLKDRKSIENWPEDGSIEFENVSMRYRDGLPLVLNNLTLEIKHKEKIGIAGRTGAGKSSIAVALYRIVNLEEGVIRIAGRDIASLGLTDLRSKLSIIPQDPVLFIGSIRYNLDPFEQHEDEELWSALEKAHIKNMISDLPGKLESPVLENGSNFSVGERQLICMARALLRKSKVLILDEATAAIDSKTDSKIQETIKESFSDCTVLTVAHRLNTIMHCDKILVMDKGEVAEFESPGALLGKQDSMFKKMVFSANVRLK